MKTLYLTAPSAWAPYLINGDVSGLDQYELEACDDWLLSLGVSDPVSCEDAGFRHTHDASDFAPLSTDCQEYAFI